MSAPSQLSNTLAPILVTMLNESPLTPQVKRVLMERLDALFSAPHHPPRDAAASRGVHDIPPTPGVAVGQLRTPLQKNRICDIITQGQHHIAQRSTQFA